MDKNKIEIVLTIISEGAWPTIIANGNKKRRKSEIFFKFTLFKIIYFFKFFPGFQRISFFPLLFVYLARTNYKSDNLFKYIMATGFIFSFFERETTFLSALLVIVLAICK